VGADDRDPRDLSDGSRVLATPPGGSRVLLIGVDGADMGIVDRLIGEEAADVRA
jgi:hypothetical protein